jgi:hypothetical protein
MSDTHVCRLRFPDGSEDSLAVTHIDDEVVVLHETSLLQEEYRFGTKIAVRVLDGNVLEVREIVAKSTFETLEFLLPQAVAESPYLDQLLSRVVAEGGGWERMFGGVLLVHIPEKRRINVAAQLERITSFLSERTPSTLVHFVSTAGVKSVLEELPGKRIVGFVFKESAENHRPYQQIFLTFEDGTYLELYSDSSIGIGSHCYPGGIEEALAYMPGRTVLAKGVQLPIQK